MRTNGQVTAQTGVYSQKHHGAHLQGSRWSMDVPTSQATVEDLKSSWTVYQSEVAHKLWWTPLCFALCTERRTCEMAWHCKSPIGRNRTTVQNSSNQKRNAQLVVVSIEIDGWRSEETKGFLIARAIAKARSELPQIQKRTEQTCQLKWAACRCTQWHGRLLHRCWT